jgi:hypothetical protein
MMNTRTGRLDDLCAGARNQRETLITGQQATELVLRSEPRRQFSTMMTAPSTIRPKSSAPRLIRLAEMPVLHHAGDRHQHGERNHRSGDQRCAQVAQQQEQHGDHQQRAFGQVLLHGCDGAIDQRRAVVDRCARTPSGKVRRSPPGGYWRCATSRLFSPTSMNARAQHDLFAVLRGGAGAQFATLATFRHVADADRHAIARCHDDAPQASMSRTCPGDADQVLLAVDVRCSRRRRWRCSASAAFEHVVQRQLVGQQLAGSGVMWNCARSRRWC